MSANDNIKNAPQDKQQRSTRVMAIEWSSDQFIISSEQLFAGTTEIHIRHRGALYRLKQTSLGKLILTK